MASQQNPNLRSPSNARQLWKMVEQDWVHRDYPKGQRFLGSIYISQDTTRSIWRSIAASLANIDYLTYESLEDWFGNDYQQSWIKILMLGMSDYAYYDQAEGGFWKGWCKCIGLTGYSSQSAEQTFRRVVDRGIDVLGLVRSRGGYKYVSPLWLQSGIPRQNLNQFADLLQAVSQQSSWWEIAHTDEYDLSDWLLDFCQDKYPQWRTLINFLKASCSGDDLEAEPLSGRLVKGLGTVALELERQGNTPQDLEDANQREALLKNYYLPHNFFLRDWNAITKILTPRSRMSTSSRSIVGLRKKPLVLRLDLDSFEIQLHLPEQRLWKADWKNLQGLFCRIPQTNWESRFPDRGHELIIDEQTISLKQVEARWIWQLQDHRQKELLHWEVSGIEDQKAYLIFDTWTGERVHPSLLNQSVLEIGSYREIYCFIPKTSKLSLSQGIEVLDSCVPCSLKKWHGQLLALKVDSASITIFQDLQTWQVTWRTTSAQQPILVGLQLKQRNQKNPIYLEIPTLWGVPVDSAFKLQIEDLTSRSRITSPDCSLSESGIQLGYWIQNSGLYELYLWNLTKRYSYRFAIQLEMAVPETQPPLVRITTSSTGSIQSTPVLYSSLSDFWAEQITFTGLWTFEKVLFQMGQEQSTECSTYVEQAGASGCLQLNLAKYYVSGNGAFWLKYQRYGSESQLLLCMPSSSELQVKQWTKTGIEILGLQREQKYRINCWNLLTPNAPPFPIMVQGCDSSSQMVSLSELSIGIYHLQLEGVRSQSLGCWCNNQQNDLPKATQEDSDLENYCFTIVGNESVNDFITASKKFDIDLTFIRCMVTSLQKKHFYLPKWLNQDLLLQKLQELIRQTESRNPIILPKRSPIPLATSNQSGQMPVQNRQPPHPGNWYLVVVQWKKRSIFLNLLEPKLQHQKIKEIILEVGIPIDVSYENYVLVRLMSLRTGRTILNRLEYFIKIEPKPLPIEQVNRMLGR